MLRQLRRTVWGRLPQARKERKNRRGLRRGHRGANAVSNLLRKVTGRCTHWTKRCSTRTRNVAGSRSRSVPPKRDKRNTYVPTCSPHDCRAASCAAILDVAELCSVYRDCRVAGPRARRTRRKRSRSSSHSRRRRKSCDLEYCCILLPSC